MGVIGGDPRVVSTWPTAQPTEGRLPELAEIRRNVIGRWDGTSRVNWRKGPVRPSAPSRSVRREMPGTFLTFGVLLIVASVLSELRWDQWWIRIWDFPRHQIAGLAIVLAGGLMWFGGGTPSTLLVVAALCGTAGYQGWRIFPHFPIARPEVVQAERNEPSVPFSLLTANVLQENRDADAFINVVRDYNPDVFLAIETDEWWDSAIRTLEADYPHIVSYPLDTTYGMILGSRLELVQPRIRFLVDDDIPSIHSFVRLRNGALVWLQALHPDPPNPQYATETTERDAELLIAGREVKNHEGPAVIIGDFNDVSWSPTTRLFRTVSGLVDPRVGRGFYNTFHADWPFLRWPVDHVYHSTHFKLGRLERGPHIGSDHFPMYAELELHPDAPLVQSEPSATHDEKQKTTEKILDAHQTNNHRTVE